MGFTVDVLESVGDYTLQFYRQRMDVKARQTLLRHCEVQNGKVGRVVGELVTN
jgi:hypothetical protein